MWIRDLDEMAKYFPKDDKWHDIQIVNGSLYVDGELKYPPVDGIRFFNRALTKEEKQDMYNDIKKEEKMRKVYLDELDEEKLQLLIDCALGGMDDFLEKVEMSELQTSRPGRYDLSYAIENAIQGEYHKARRHRIEDDEYWAARRRGEK